ncbi:MAG TPA: hypothetical protein VG456_04140 [Candidatus Sulfopaludibacter sp.]|jgi:hypothetical protein|nr:hypothetical protein [Candidatus Sulfopaludibacter sp.]
MDPHYDPVSSSAYAGWDRTSIASFRGGMKFGDPLVLFHELGHWFQKRSRVEWAINNMLVRAFSSSNGLRKQQLYQKASAARTLLRPYGEGLSLYLQFDYFPANYFSDFGPRCEVDALAEVIISQRFSFQKYDSLDLAELGRRASSFFPDERLNLRTLQKKMSLLSQPLGIGQEHITGYLFIKRAIANIRSYPYPFYLHDGTILQSLISYIFDEPSLFELLLDEDLEYSDFVSRFSTALQAKLDPLICDPKMGERFWRARKSGSGSAALGIDQARLDACDQRYGEICNSLLFGLKQSVDQYLLPGETIEQYEERRPTSPETLPTPVDALSLLLSMDAVKFGNFPVHLKLEGGEWSVDFDEYNLRLPLAGFGTQSPRAKLHGWLVDPLDNQEARLAEVIFLLKDDFFHVTFIDCDRGLLFLWHTTNDYNVGYYNVADYLKEPNRVDRLLGMLKAETAVSEQELFSRAERTAILGRVTKLYRGGEDTLLSEVAANSGSSGLLRVKDLFQTESEFASFVAFSLIQPIFAGTAESRASLLEKIAEYTPRFEGSSVDPAKVRRFVTRSSPWVRVPVVQREKIWSSCGTLC